jgi:tripartite-type tricarboxylate transporter receptor subunit TctC
MINNIKFFVVFAILLLLQWPGAHALDFNKKTVTVVIPFPPGGGVDQTYQHFKKYLLDKNINTAAVYKSGAEGLIGMNEIEKSPNDGYTVSVGTAGTVAIHRIKNSNSNLIVVSAIRNSVTAFVTSKTSGLTTFQDIDYDIRKNNHVKIGQGAPGQKMSLQQLINIVNPNYQHSLISYRGGALVVNDLLGGHIDLAALPLSLVHSHIQANRLVLVGIAAKNKLYQYPNADLIQNKYPNWKDFDGFVLILPPNTPTAIVDTWRNIVSSYVSDPMVIKNFEDQFFEPLPMGQEYAEQLVKQSVDNLR